MPLLSRTNRCRSSTCIRFASYLEYAGRTASATLVLDRAHSSSIKSVLLKTQLRWVGHVIGMEEHCMPLGLTYGELASGKRYLGHPKKCYKDSFKGNLHWCNIKPKDFKSCAGDRLLWRARVHQATTSFEDARSQ